MRKIKFRQWIGSEFHYWGFLEVGRFDGPVHVFGKGVPNSQQYTGLKDKNGKEIYEGDVVKGLYQAVQCYGEPGGDIKMCGEVIYDHVSFRLKVVQSKSSARNGMVNYFNFVADDGGIFEQKEVIGNIYENPELLGH